LNKSVQPAFVSASVKVFNATAFAASCAVANATAATAAAANVNTNDFI
jgi:hypothetical protein